MQNLNDDLRDPSPPVPGAHERAVVARRAQQLHRRRRLVQGGGALAVVAIATVGVAALLTGGGGNGHSTSIEIADSAAETTAAPTTTAPATTTAAPTTVPVTVPAPLVATPTTAATLSAPSAVNVGATVTGNLPPGVTFELTLVGDGGTYRASTNGAQLSFGAIPPGTYDAAYEWVDSSGTAIQVGKLGTYTFQQDSTLNITLG